MVHVWVLRGSHLPPGREYQESSSPVVGGGDGSGPLNCSTEKQRERNRPGEPLVGQNEPEFKILQPKLVTA